MMPELNWHDYIRQLILDKTLVISRERVLKQKYEDLLDNNPSRVGAIVISLGVNFCFQFHNATSYFELIFLLQFNLKLPSQNVQDKSHNGTVYCLYFQVVMRTILVGIRYRQEMIDRKSHRYYKIYRSRS